MAVRTGFPRTHGCLEAAVALVMEVAYHQAQQSLLRPLLHRFATIEIVELEVAARETKDLHTDLKLPPVPHSSTDLAVQRKTIVEAAARIDLGNLALFRTSAALQRRLLTLDLGELG